MQRHRTEKRIRLNQTIWADCRQVQFMFIRQTFSLDLFPQVMVNKSKPPKNLLSNTREQNQVSLRILGQVCAPLKNPESSKVRNIQHWSTYDHVLPNSDDCCAQICAAPYACSPQNHWSVWPRMSTRFTGYIWRFTKKNKIVCRADSRKMHEVKIKVKACMVRSSRCKLRLSEVADELQLLHD